MIIIVDTNIIIAALLKDGLSRKILRTNEEFIVPEFLFVELRKYHAEILRKSGISQDGFEFALLSILENVQVATQDIVDRKYDEAYEIMKIIDPEDTQHLACALAYPGSIIWSEDTDMREQKVVHVMTMKEMKVFLNR